jgi:maleamate amidohydrolase
VTDRYQTIGYGSSRIGYGRRPAILVVDLQVAFTDPRYPLGRMDMVQKATDRTAELLEVARARDVPVAKCYTAYCSEGDMPRWKVADVHDHFYYGDPSTAIDPRVDDRRDFTFCKNAPSIFFLTPLITFLTKHQVDTTIVTGCTTSGCVRASVIDAFSYGFRVIVPEDCVGDADEGPHRANLNDVGRRYADIVTANEVEAYLQTLGADAGATVAGARPERAL